MKSDLFQVGALVLAVAGLAGLTFFLWGAGIAVSVALLAIATALWFVGREIDMKHGAEQRRLERLERNRLATQYVAENPDAPIERIAEFLSGGD